MGPGDGPRSEGARGGGADVVVAGSFEHQQLIAVGALASAASVVLNHPSDPLAAEAEAQFETVLEVVVQLHWSPGGDFDGVAHPGIKRQAGRVLLEGVARVRGGADRPLRVDISPTAGGTVMIDTPARKRRGLGWTKGPEVASTQVVRIPSTATPLGYG